MTAATLQRLEREGVVERPYRGVIALTGAPVDGWARLWRASFAVGPWAVVDGRAAAWAHGFWLLGDLWPTIEIAVAHGCRRPAIPGVKVVRVRRLEAEWLPRRGELSVASVDETLRQLGGVLSAKDLTAHVDEALRRRLTFVSWLRRFVAARPFDGTPGMTALRRVVRGDLTVTASEFERRLLAAFRAAGLPRPQVGAVVDGREADFWWPERQTICEADSAAWHTRTTDIRDDIAKHRTWRANGRRVIRASFDDAIHPRSLCAELGRLLADPQVAA